MTGRGIATGLSLLCALALCASGASSVSAAGTTTFTCVAAGEKNFSDSDCTTEVAPGTGTFSHVAAPKTSTKTVLKKTKTTTELGTIIGGVETILTATGFTSKTTTSENKERASKEMFVQGNFGGEYTGVTFLSGPEGCKVKGSAIKILTTQSESVPAAMEIEFKPVGAFAEFTLESCKIGPLSKTYQVTGTFKGLSKGALLEFNAASTSGMKVSGQPAFYEDTLTVTGESGNPLTLTTTSP